MPAKEYPGGSAASELALAMDDGEEPAQAILVKSLRVAGTAAFLYFAKEYAEYYKQSEIAAVLAKEKMYKAVSADVRATRHPRRHLIFLIPCNEIGDVLRRCEGHPDAASEPPFAALRRWRPQGAAGATGPARPHTEVLRHGGGP